MAWVFSEILRSRDTVKDSWREYSVKLLFLSIPLKLLYADGWTKGSAVEIVEIDGKFQNFPLQFHWVGIRKYWTNNERTFYHRTAEEMGD
jgi:hypothetical protein